MVIRRLRDIFKAGAKTAGGCDECEAHQRIDEPSPGIFVITIVHDDNCPFIAARRNAHR